MLWVSKSGFPISCANLTIFLNFSCDSRSFNKLAIKLSNTQHTIELVVSYAHLYFGSFWSPFCTWCIWLGKVLNFSSPASKADASSFIPASGWLLCRNWHLLEMISAVSLFYTRYSFEHTPPFFFYNHIPFVLLVVVWAVWWTLLDNETQKFKAIKLQPWTTTGSLTHVGDPIVTFQASSTFWPKWTFTDMHALSQTYSLIEAPCAPITSRCPLTHCRMLVSSVDVHWRAPLPTCYAIGPMLVE